MKEATLYDELDTVIDKMEKEIASSLRSVIFRSVANDLRDIRDRLPDEIEEITVITTNNVVDDVLVNGKQTNCYCVVPKDQLKEYLKKRGFDATT